MESLQRRGARVTGFDSSTAMLDIARRRLGPDADLHHLSIDEPLPFADDAFDDVIACLVLHYVEAWGPMLAELHRVLKPAGRLIAAVNHPFAETLTRQAEGKPPRYFDTFPNNGELEFAGQKVELMNWHRPLHATTDAFLDAGFTIRRIAEPPFSPDTPEDVIPEHLKGRSAFLCFLFFVLQAGQADQNMG